MKFVKMSSCEKRATMVMKSTSTGGYGILGIDEFIYTETGTLLKGKPCIIIDELLATPLQSAGCFMYIYMAVTILSGKDAADFSSSLINCDRIPDNYFIFGIGIPVASFQISSSYSIF